MLMKTHTASRPRLVQNLTKARKNVKYSINLE
jgi:hypothetical protein